MNLYQIKDAASKANLHKVGDALRDMVVPEEVRQAAKLAISTEQVNIRFPREWIEQLRELSNRDHHSLIKKLVFDYLSPLCPYTVLFNEQTQFKLLWFRPEVLDTYRNTTEYTLTESTLRQNNGLSCLQMYIDCIRKPNDIHCVGAHLRHLIMLSSKDQIHWLRHQMEDADV